MIVAMKKAFLIVLDSKRHESLLRLRAFGAVHVEAGSGSSAALEEQLEKAAMLTRARAAIGEGGKKTGAGSGRDLAEALTIAGRINTLADERKSARDGLDRFEKELDRLAVWGEFRLDDIAALESSGLRVGFYEISLRAYKAWKPACASFVVFRRKKKLGLVCFARPAQELPADALPRPAHDPARLASLIEEHQAKIAELDGRLDELTVRRGQLSMAAFDQDGLVEFERVAAGMQSAERLAVLSGFIPEKKTRELKELAAANGWGLLLRDPAADETVPTMIDNPKWIRIIQPIFNVLGVAPGYREIDISPFFLFFFIIFYSMIIGDAGYGTLFLLGTLYFMFREKKLSGRTSDGTRLLALLNICMIAWGALTGNWFGSPYLNKHPWLAWMVVPRLDGYVDANTDFIKQVALTIGLVHLTISHVWNFLRDIAGKPRYKALAQLGWLSMLWGLYFFVLYFVLDPKKFPIPPAAPYMIIVGYVLVMTLGQQTGDGFVKGILRGLGAFIPTTLSSVSVFADIVSYIRLFAVGLAGVEIAKSFNVMSSGLSSLGVWGIVPMILILAAGHGLNMAMSALAVIVHGVRLNMLEFSGHLGMEWSGFDYKPFRERS